MTRIAFIAGTYQPDRCGVADYTARLRNHLTDQGIESVVLTTYTAAHTAPGPDVEGVVSNWHVGELKVLVQAVHRTKADLLHIQHAAGTYGFQRAIFLLPLLLRWSGWRAPIVTTIHEYGWWEWQPRFMPPRWLEWLKTTGQHRGWWDREDGFLLTHSQAVITTNHDAEQALHTRLPQLSDRFHRIAIGANIETTSITPTAARQQLRQTYGWSPETPILAFFGFLHPVKGLETLLLAFKQVIAAHPQVRLLLMGGVNSLALPDVQATQYWEKLQTTIANLGLTAAVQMTGYLDRLTVSQTLAGVDIGVLPFNHGVTLKSGSLLAMLSHGLPVVAARATPPDLELEQGQRVWLVEPRDVQGLACALDRLLTDSALRTHLSQAGQVFSRQFDWFSIATAHRQLYDTVLARLSLSPSRR